MTLKKSGETHRNRRRMRGCSRATSLALPGSFGPEADSDPRAAQSAARSVAQPEPEPELPVGSAEKMR